MATENTDASLTFEDIKAKSVLIHSGPPALYQLTPKEENIGTLRRMTLGEKDPNKINKTVLLVGETGAGKSALINTLVNYTMGVKWEHKLWFKIIKDKDRSQTESQTSDVIVYQVFGFEGQTLPYSLTIIDTPGYGDTRGTGQDVSISQRLLDLFRSEDGVHQINAVGLVLKASDNRLSDRLRYIFDSVVSLFGKDLEKKIVALITHSDGMTPENALKGLEVANIKFAKDEENQPVYFMFNNTQSKQRTKKEMISLKFAWELTTNQLDEFTDFLKQSGPQNLMTTIEVLKERIRLTACINNLQERMKLIELQQKEVQQTEEGLKKYEEEMKNNKNFTIEVNEAYKVKEEIGWWRWLTFNGSATSCKICEENCHHPGCTVARTPAKCEVMKDGHCTSCTRKCPVSDHVKEKWIYVTKTRKVQKTLEDVKAKYEKGKKDCEESKGLLENLQENLKDLQRDKDQMLEQSYQHVVQLEQIALNVDSLSTHVHLDFLIEKMKEKGDREKVQKLEEMRSRMDEDEGKRSGLQYATGHLKVAGKVVKEAVTKK